MVCCCLAFMRCQDGYACHGGPYFFFFYLGILAVSHAMRPTLEMDGEWFIVRDAGVLGAVCPKGFGRYRACPELLDLDLATFSLVSRVFV
ncbi:hypothetical protein GGI43DRAFT_79144 [Trichoderma evansii]